MTTSVSKTTCSPEIGRPVSQYAGLSRVAPGVPAPSLKLDRAGELTAVWIPDQAHEAIRDLVRGSAVCELDPGFGTIG